MLVGVVVPAGRYINFRLGYKAKKNMGKYYCCVTKCHNFSGRVGSFGRHVTLHKLPKEVYTRRAWIRLISRKNWKPSSYTRVCSDHFKDGVRTTSQDRNKIPSENLPQKQIKGTAHVLPVWTNTLHCLVILSGWNNQIVCTYFKPGKSKGKGKVREK